MKPNRLTPLRTLTLGAALSTTAANAASSSWNVDADGNWSTATSWASSTIPGSTSTTDSSDIATFGKALTAARTVTVDANRNIGGITFSHTSTVGYTLSSGSIKLSNGGTIQLTSASGNHIDTISSPIELQGDGGTATFSNSSANGGRLLSSGAISGVSTTGKTTTLTLGGTQTGTNTVSGVISNGTAGGNLALVKSGAGNWVLSNTGNSFSGGTSISAGAIQATSAGALGTGPVTLSGGALHLINNNNTTFANNITVTGDAQIAAAMTSGSSGNVTHTAGTLTIGANTLTISKFFSQTTGRLNVGATTLTGNATFVTNTALTLALGAVSGDYSITKGGSGATSGGTATTIGSMILTADNTYTGGTTINYGTLQVGTGGATGTLGSGPVTIASGASLQILRNKGATFGQSISGAGSVTVNAPGSVIEFSNASYTGTTTLQRGTLISDLSTTSFVVGTTGSQFEYAMIGLKNNFTGAVSWAGNSASGGFVAMDPGTRSVNLGGNATPDTLTLGTGGFYPGTGLGGDSRIAFGDSLGTAKGSIDFLNPINLGTGTRGSRFVVNGSAPIAATLRGAVTGLGLTNGAGDALVKFGNGNLMLAGANTYTGRTVVGGQGSIVLGSNDAFSPNTWMSLDGGNAGTLGGILGLGNGDLAATLGTTGGRIHFNASGGFAAFGGDRSITLNGGGTLTWASTTSFVGNGQNLILGESKADGKITVANPIDLNGAARTVHVNDGSAAVDAELSGGLSGTNGALVKTGAGTLILGSTSSYTGNTTVSAGKLLVNGSIATSALTTVNAAATLGGSGTLGATTVAGTHSPGNSPGVQTFSGDLTYSAGSSIVWELIANSTGGRGTNFDGIDLTAASNLAFSATTTLNLDFALAGSGVDWSDTLWDRSITGTNGWRLFDLDTGTISGLGNLTLATSAWVDGQGDRFDLVRPLSSFSWFADGNDLYLNYTNASPIPEPGSLLGLAAVLGSPLLVRRRKRA